MPIDSDVLVSLTRGHLLAAQRLHEMGPWRISAVTYIALAQPCRDKGELARLKKRLAARQTGKPPITPAVSQRAVGLFDAPGLSHGMRLADALIGATVAEHGLTPISGNVRHLGAVGGLQIEAFSP